MPDLIYYGVVWLTPAPRALLLLLYLCPAPPHPQAVTSYFSQANPSALPYGFVPEIASLKNAAGKAAAGTKSPAAAGSGVGGGGVDGTLTESITKTERALDAEKDPAAAAAAAVPPKEAFGAGGELARTTNQEQQREQLPVTEVESEEDLGAFLVAAGRGRLVLVDFGAEWCKNCKAILASVLTVCVFFVPVSAPAPAPHQGLACRSPCFKYI